MTWDKLKLHKYYSVTTALCLCYWKIFCSLSLAQVIFKSFENIIVKCINVCFVLNVHILIFYPSVPIFEILINDKFSRIFNIFGICFTTKPSRAKKSLRMANEISKDVWELEPIFLGHKFAEFCEKTNKLKQKKWKVAVNVSFSIFFCLNTAVYVY